jgi:hypothetical protein
MPSRLLKMSVYCAHACIPAVFVTGTPRSVDVATATRQRAAEALRPFSTACWRLSLLLGGLIALGTPTMSAAAPPAKPGAGPHQGKGGGKGKVGEKGKKGKKGKQGNKGGPGKKGKSTPGIGPFDKGDYPLQERLRPLVLPDRMGEVGLDLSYENVAGADFALVQPSFSYGIADVVDVGLASSLLLAPDVAWGRDITLQGHYLAVDTKDLDFAPGLVLPLVLAEGAGFGAVIDLPTRYVLNDKVFFTFGQGAVPLTFSPDFGLAVQATGGVYVQADKGLVFGVDTTPFVLTIAPTAAVSGVWDVLIVDGLAQYSWDRAWDVGVRIGLVNVWGVDDALRVSATAYGRFRF